VYFRKTVFNEFWEKFGKLDLLRDWPEEKRKREISVPE